MTKDMLLPCSLEAERGVLGSIIIDADALTLVADFLQPQHFYREAHRVIYEAMLFLAGQNVPADFVLVAQELERRNQLDAIGGSAYLAGLMSEVPTSRNIEHYARIVAKKWEHRELIRASSVIAALAYEEEENAVEKAEAEIYRIGQGVTSKPVVLHRDALNRYMTALDALHSQGQQGILVGVTTGYPLLDKKLGGLRKSKMYVLAGRPGDGKTGLALCIADAAVCEGCNVLFFSLEMEEEELMQRWMAMTTKIDSQNLRDGTISSDPDRQGLTEWDRVVAGYEQLLKLPGKLLIDDTPLNTLSAMRSKSRRMQAEHGIDLIIVDYLQFAKVGDDDRYENRRLEVEAVSRGLKQLARELKVPVLALAQLNRDVEGRANRQPQLSDLREAGGIEQDCDVAVFIHKDANVPKDATEYNVTLLIEKNRNGEKGTVPLYFIGKETRFYPVAITSGNNGTGLEQQRLD